MNGSSLRRRFWLESILAVLTAVAAIATILWPEWIEMIFRIEPDEGSGMLELGVTLAIAIVSVLFALLARLEWKRQTALARD